MAKAKGSWLSEPKYKDSMPQQAYELLSQGRSITRVAVNLGVHKATLYRWINPESKYFKQALCDAIKRGLEASEAIWEDQGQDNIRDKEFNHVLWYMNMKNRFGWSDKNENKTEGTLTIKIQEVNASDDDSDY